MSFFRAAGRIRRRSYLMRQLLLILVGVGIYALPELLEEPEMVNSSIRLAAAAGLVLVYYLLVVQMIKRLHDLDMRGWWLLGALLPVVSYLIGAGLEFVQGTVGPNRWGPDPKRPHLLPPPSLPVGE